MDENLERVLLFRYHQYLPPEDQCGLAVSPRRSHLDTAVVLSPEDYDALLRVRDKLIAENRRPPDLDEAALDIAVQFHEVYERLAPKFGYETRADTRTFDPESANGRLMIAVCRKLLDPETGKASAVPVEATRKEGE